MKEYKTVEFQRFDISKKGNVRAVFKYNGKECRVFKSNQDGNLQAVPLKASGYVSFLFKEAPGGVTFDGLPDRWCRVGVDPKKSEITLYAYYLNTKNNKGLLVIKYNKDEDSCILDEDSRFALNVDEFTEEPQDTQALNQYLDGKSIPEFNPAEIDEDKEMAKYAHKAPINVPAWLKGIGKVLNHAAGFLTGLATFWLYIPQILKDVYNDGDVLGTNPVYQLFSIIFFPLTLAVTIVGALAIPGITADQGFIEAWKPKLDLSQSKKLYAWYQMPLSFLNGVLGVVLGIALTTLFYPLMKTMNYLRACLDVILKTNENRGISTGLRVRAFLKLLFITPFVLVSQLIAAPFRGFWYGKDGLGRVLQTFFDTLNNKPTDTKAGEEAGEEEQKAGDAAVASDKDYTKVGIRDVMIASVYLALIAFVTVAVILATASTGGFGGLILAGLSKIGFTGAGSTLATAFAGAGITAGLAAAGTTMLAIGMRIAAYVAKLTGLFGESANALVTGLASSAAGIEPKAKPKGIQKVPTPKTCLLIREAKAQSETERKAEIAGGKEGKRSFDSIFKEATPDVIERFTEALRPGLSPAQGYEAL